MPIEFISILLVLGIGQCVFLIVAILIDRQRFQTANRLLLALLFAFAWYQLEFLLLRETLDSKIPFLYSTRYGSWLLIGPLLLLYNRATLIEGFRFRRRHGWHFMPFLLFTVILPVLFGEVVTDRATHYGMLTVFDAFNQEVINWKHYLYGGIFVLQFIHAATYVYFAFRETRRLEESAKQQRSSLPTSRMATLKYLYLSSLVIVALCSAFVLYIFFTTMWKRNMDYLYVLPMSLMVYGLAYRAMKFPNSTLILSAEEESASAKYARSGLSPADKLNYLQRLDKQLEEEMLYRNNELRLGDLAAAVGVSNHHLSQLLNEEKQRNFFDYINDYRVAEARQRIRRGDNGTLLQIAFAVGFNNKNSFNTAFKKRTGMTPSAFRKKAMNEQAEVAN